jgi:hypothetical protein
MTTAFNNSCLSNFILLICGVGHRHWRNIMAMFFLQNIVNYDV